MIYQAESGAALLSKAAQHDAGIDMGLRCGVLTLECLGVIESALLPSATPGASYM